MTRPFPAQDAVVVITGAGSGIGRAAAVSFARRGARVVVSDLRADRADEVAAEILVTGGSAVGIGVDVTRQEDLEALRDRALDRFGRVDVVMNNAGVLAMGAPESLPDEAWAKTLDVNLMGMARSNRVFLPLLLAQGRGHVVNTASASGLLSYGFDRLPYVASKHAVVGVSEALARYLGPRGIGVTCVCPSGVLTNIVEQITTYGQVSASPRAPAHAVVPAEDVGELIVGAVEAGRYLVVTVPEIHEELVERAQDIEAYLLARIAEQNGMTARPRVGFVGLGSQGGPMARRIIDAGFPTTLWARRAPSLEPYAGTPASSVDSLPELGAACDVLCVCVVDDAGVDGVLRGPQGALAGMRPGGVVVIHSTVHPQTCRQLQADYPQLKILDAPVSGGGGRAAEGTLLVMVGGDASTLDSCRSVLESFADPLVHLGPLGSGQEAKLLNNALFTAQLGLAAEVFALAQDRGLDLPGLATVLRGGSARSYAADVIAGAGHRLDAMAALAGPLLAKDVGILAALLRPASPPLIAVADSALRGMGLDGSSGKDAS